MTEPHPSRSRILYVGDLWRGSTALMRLQAIADLGFDVIPLDTSMPGTASRVRHPIHYLARKLRRPLDPVRANRRIREMDTPVDLVLLDKCLEIHPSTLDVVRRKWPDCFILGYSPDDMAQAHNTSKFFVARLPLLDGFITTKSYNVAELKAMGARNVIFVNQGYDPALHRPPSPSVAPTADVGFIGTFEAERAESVLHLARAGIPVNIRGSGWGPWAQKNNSAVAPPMPPVYFQDYVDQIWSTRINLCFLRKLNRDQQTSRTMEIPACGGFMLAERTPEHQALFVEGVEAAFFDGDDELEEKVRYYLANEDERKAIATAGMQRCMSSGYSYSEQFRYGLEQLGVSVPSGEWPE